MTSQEFTTRTLRLRLKDKHAAFLHEQACAVNFVWNYVNELSVRHFERQREFLSAYDMQPYTKGASKELGLLAQTVQAVQEDYVARRKQFKRVKLRWRVSRGARRSLGWVPVKGEALRYRSGQVWYCGKPLSLWDSYGLHQYELGSGSFSEDSRGRWYLNVTVRVARRVSTATQAVGIDLGLKGFCVTSDGAKVDGHRFYRDFERAIASAQRANKTQRVRALHAKVKNRRKDALNKLSTNLVSEYGAIFIGNVSATALARTSMAKAVHDAGWSAFRTMLQYKCDCAGVWFQEVNEAFSTQTCSCCGSLTGPKGVTGLGIREWTCQVCVATHDRDINAAKNIRAKGMAARPCGAVLQDGVPDTILAAGRGRLAEGILTSSVEADVN